MGAAAYGTPLNNPADHPSNQRSEGGGGGLSSMFGGGGGGGGGNDDGGEGGKTSGGIIVVEPHVPCAVSECRASSVVLGLKHCVEIPFVRYGWGGSLLGPMSSLAMPSMPSPSD